MFIAFDIETTGFSATQNDIIQFSYIMFDEFNQFVKSETLYFYYSGMSWSEEAETVHKIPISFLEQFAEDFEKNIIKMYSILHHANIVGFNSMKFDAPFCATWLMRMGLDGLVFNIQQDIMLAFRPVTKRPQIKLTKLCDMMGVTPDIINQMETIWFPDIGATHVHNANYDTVATALLAFKGINMKLITFEPAVKLASDIELPGVGVDALETSETKSMNFDPAGYIVTIQRHDDEPEYYRVNHNHVIYDDDDMPQAYVTMAISENKFIDKVFKQQDENTFVLELKDFTVTLKMDKEAGDTVTFKNVFGEYPDTVVDIQSFIKNLE